MRVLHITSHNENCGIAIYQENYVAHMQELKDNDVFVHDFFPHSPTHNKSLTKKQFKKVTDDLKSVIKQYDLVHLQHEYAFYAPYQLQQIVDIVKRHKKPLVATVHTNPVVRQTQRRLASVKGILARVRNVVLNKIYLDAFLPLRKADVILVHNSFTKKTLESLGFSSDRVKLWFHPVYVAAPKAAEIYSEKTNFVNQAINRQKDDIVLATVGYINFTKGGMAAVKTLSLLPENYKLIMIGGIHPTAHNDAELDLIADEIVRNKLSERIFVTGHVANDAEFDAHIQNADIIGYLYQSSYASSSGAVNKAISNHKPIVATPVKAFLEMNNDADIMELTDSFSYLDMARSVEKVSHNIGARKNTIESYAKKHSFTAYAEQLIDLYETLK